MEREPDWLDPYWDFLVVCGENGRPNEAREVLRTALLRFPDKRDELRELARSLRLPT